MHACNQHHNVAKEMAGIVYLACVHYTPQCVICHGQLVYILPVGVGGLWGCTFWVSSPSGISP